MEEKRGLRPRQLNSPINRVNNKSEFEQFNKMIKIAILVTLVASAISQSANELCQSNCKAMADNTKLYCGTDGNPYNSLCKAQCRDATISQVFVCNADYLYSKDLCAPKCAKNLRCRNLYAKSPRAPLGYICASDALIYPSLDEVNCNGVQFAADISANDQASLDSCLQTVKLLFGQPSGTAAPPRK